MAWLSIRISSITLKIPYARDDADPADQSLSGGKPRGLDLDQRSNGAQALCFAHDQ
jgi:hypothetical protein